MIGLKGRRITGSVSWVGAIDWDRRFFDEVISLPDGTSYNSYLVKGSEKTALIDTVDPSKTSTLLEELKGVERIDYIISNHAEQDHSGSIPAVMARYPESRLVCNELCSKMLKDELRLPEDRITVIKDGDELSLGDRTLKFIFTPWVHWPETMCTLLKEEKILFSCDFFGSHLATSAMYADEHIEGPAKRYYSEIMMPFANIIVKNLEKVRAAGPVMIAPSHGPIHKNPDFILGLYEEWTSPRVKPKVVVAYVSMHGSTRQMVEYLINSLMGKGVYVQEYNLREADVGKIAMDLVDASTFIIASPSFLGGLHPLASSAVSFLNALHPKTKLLSFLGSFEWGSKAKEQYEQLTCNFRAERLEPFMVQGLIKDERCSEIDAFAEKIYSKHIDMGLIAPTAPMETKSSDKDFSIVLCGEAGQGLETVYSFLTELLKQEGYNLFASKEYMSRVRGGENSVQIIVSEQPMYGRLDRIDLFLPLDEDAYDHVFPRISRDTIIIGDKSVKESAAHKKLHDQVIEVPFIEMASKIGNKVYANTIASAVILGLLGANLENFNALIRSKFADKEAEIISKNIEAAAQGYALGVSLRSNPKVGGHDLSRIRKDESVKGDLLLAGSEAIAYGAIAGGCNFISAYPMSPSTGVLIVLAKNRFKFNIIVEQAEDEIAGINMGIGASYAGARALANTSGGGFALMEEGVSLAAMLETPLVIHVAQRPGPATGLPTRTAQEDLNLVLYSGHGEYPRVIYAPGTASEGFVLTQKAFNMAAKYQLPVFVLTDQHFMDTLQNIRPFDIAGLDVEDYIVEAGPDYKRYALTSNGISPMALPGGKGFVCADSDEHDEHGQITESMDVRNRMVEKRFAKMPSLIKDSVPPKEYNSSAYKYLVISWGSTHGSVLEALTRLGRKDIGYLHYSQVYPLHPSTSAFIAKADKAVVIEQNATGQFAGLIRKETGLKAESLLRYDGIAFSVEEIIKQLERMFP